VSQQFQDEEFAGVSGARVVRIATNPDYISMGYGSRALELLNDFYEGKFISLDDSTAAVEQTITRVTDTELANSSLLDDDIKVRDIKKMPPRVTKLSARRPDNLDYVGVSYGLTQSLHRFWKRASFVPVYLRQTPNDLTGEHTCVMLRPLERSDDKEWAGAFARDFHRRLLSLLSYQFRDFASVLALSVNESANSGFKLDPSYNSNPLSKKELDDLLSPFDLKRLESYANNMLDYHVVLDLIPTLATLYFTGRLSSAMNLTGIQQSILLAVGLQRKDLSAVESELSLPSSQLLAMFIKIMRKMSSHFSSLVNGAAVAEMSKREKVGVSRENASAAHDDELVDERFVALETSLDEELDEAGDEAQRALKEKQRELLNALPLDQ
jgi:N-acetyltransferase 10